MLSPRLSTLVRELAARRDHTPATLGAALRHDFDIDDVAPFVRFDPRSYVRSLVSQGDGWEVRLLCWRPGQASTLHGHGESACAFRILRGSAVEAVLGKRDRVLVPGNVVDEEHGEYVHQVGNAGSDPLLSLHLYSPPLPVDAPSSPEGPAILIAGGGFAGVAVAVHLLRRADKATRVVIVERGPALGLGAAYGVDSRSFLLNVPASKMSLDPDAPDDFVRWAGSEAAPDAFLPRAVYGAYVVQRLREALRASKGKVRLVRGEVVRVEDGQAVLGSGACIEAAATVLATGAEPRPCPDLFPSDLRVVDARDEAGVASLSRSGRLLLLGAGLTALDVLLFLDAHGFGGDVTIVSRHGLLPRPPLTSVRPAPVLPSEALSPTPGDLRELLAWGRCVVDGVTARGEPWQLGIDALRPHTPALWRALSSRDRARFARTVRPYWEVLRHRAPARAMELVGAYTKAGRLEVLAGTVAGCEAGGAGLDVELRLARGGARRERFDAVVRCTGPALVRAEADSELVKGLVGSGRAAVDAAGLGIVTDDLGRVVRPDGAADPSLLAIGALRRASAWETTSVPEIVRHAVALAAHLTDTRSCR